MRSCFHNKFKKDRAVPYRSSKSDLCNRYVRRGFYQGYLELCISLVFTTGMPTEVATRPVAMCSTTLRHGSLRAPTACLVLLTNWNWLNPWTKFFVDPGTLGFIWSNYMGYQPCCQGNISPWCKHIWQASRLPCNNKRTVCCWSDALLQLTEQAGVLLCYSISNGVADNTLNL